MKKVFILIFILISINFNLSAKTLVLIGGGKRPAKALEYFVKKSLPEKNIVILPWGTSYPQESFETIKNELIQIGVPSDLVVCLCDENFYDDDLTTLENAGALYFPGGNQNKIMDKILKYNLKHVIHSLYNNNIPVAGTSAGTAIQSDPMLIGNESEVAEGLGLLKGFIVDQHFHKRSRQTRLVKALRENPGYKGLGIDEDMSLVIANERKFITIGPSIVSIYMVTDQTFQRIDLTE